MIQPEDAIRKLAQALAATAKLDGLPMGDGATASVEIDGQTIQGSGWYSDEAEQDLVQKIVAWATTIPRMIHATQGDPKP